MPNEHAPRNTSANSAASGPVQPIAWESKGPAPRKAKSRLPLIIAIIVVVLLLCLLLWYFLRDTPGDDPGTPGTPGGVGGTITGTPQTPMTPGGADALKEVRALLLRQAPPIELREALERFITVDGAEDAVFLLVEELAEIDPDLRLRYAAYFDPTDERPTGTIEKDPEAALREYRRAQVDGAVEAAVALRTLRDWAEREAAAGNAAAADLLENW